MIIGSADKRSLRRTSTLLVGISAVVLASAFDAQAQSAPKTGGMDMNMPMSHGDHAGAASMSSDADLAKATDGGSFYVQLIPPQEGIPFNDYMAMDVQVFEGHEQTRPVEDARIGVHVEMPHGHSDKAHGMNTQPQITANQDGTFLVDGLLFHMRGPWVLSVDVTQENKTERATFDIDCCGG